METGFTLRGVKEIHLESVQSMPSNRTSAKRRTSTAPAWKGKSKNKSTSGGEDLYQLESLKDYEVRNGTEYFLVKWEGYPDEQNTWEPVTNIVRPTQELIDQMIELRSLSQSVPKSQKSAKDSSKKRKIEGTGDRKSRPSKSQKTIDPDPAATRPHHKRSKEVSENTLKPNGPACTQDDLTCGSREATDVQSNTQIRCDALSPHSVRNLSHNEEDTSPEEASASHFRTDRLSSRSAQALVGVQSDSIPSKPVVGEGSDKLIREDWSVESVCKEPKAQPYEEQENVFPICLEGLEFLSHLSVVVAHTQVWQTEGPPGERVDVTKAKRPLLEVAEKHTKALLSYFLQNVRYYKHSKPSAPNEDAVDPQASAHAGCQASVDVKEATTQTLSCSPSHSPKRTASSEVSLPVTPKERRGVATVPNSAAPRSVTSHKVGTVG